MRGRKIELAENQVKKCINFAAEFITNDKSDLDFGNSSLPRGKIDRIADCAEGKIGELAFKLFAKEFDVEIDMDFELIHGRLKIDDGQDIKRVKHRDRYIQPKLKVDVKTSRFGSKWLLVEDHKYGEEWADAYVFVTVNLAPNIESDLASLCKSVDCIVHGYCYAGDLVDKNGEAFFQYDSQSKNRLLRYDIAKKLIQDAEGTDNEALSRKGIERAFKQSLAKNEISRNKLFMGPRLKCPSQKGFPVAMLRNRDADFDSIFSALVSS